MRFINSVRFRLRALLQRDAVHAEFDDELRFHIERETVANLLRGHSSADARRIALAEFGGVERFKEDLRDERGLRWLHDLVADIKHGFRLLRTNALFSGAVIGTLALGIGATTTVFAVVNGVLLQALPYNNANRIVSISESSKGRIYNSVTRTNFTEWQQSARSFRAIAGFDEISLVLTDAGEPAHITGGKTTASFFTVLGAHAALGRVYNAGEEQTGAASVAVIGDALWRGRFGADPKVIGRTITLDGVPRTIVGVMSPEFDLPRGAQYWLPMPVLTPGVRMRPVFDAIGLLKDDVTVQAAGSELASMVARSDAARPQADRGNGIAIATLHTRLFGAATKPLSLLFGAVVTLLLIACANVANLSLSRSVSRQREFAVRLALGASRWRLVRQLLVEGSILASLGGGVGVAVAAALVSSIVKMSPGKIAGLDTVHVDGTVLLFAALTTMFVTIAFGLAPALHGSRSRGQASLAAGGARTSASKAHSAFRGMLVVFQFAAALTLTTGAGLLTKSFARALAIAPGFQAAHVYSAVVQLPGTRYAETARVQAFYSEMAMQVRALPGVESASLSDALPLSVFQYSTALSRPDGSGAKTEVAVSTADEYFGATLGLTLIDGRFITAADQSGNSPVAVITASAAKALFPNDRAVGQSLKHAFQGNAGEPVVVGVVSDVAQQSIEQKPVPQIFLAAAQMNMWPAFITARTTMSGGEYQRALKRIIANIDPQQPLTKFMNMDEELIRAVAPRQFNSMLVNAFAAAALILAMVGLYALMAHGVASRTREIGIRVALGATRTGVLQLVMRQGMLLTALGLTLGIAASFALSRLLGDLLFEVSAHDAMVFLGAPGAMIVVAIVACALPARRATRVSPMLALREE